MMLSSDEMVAIFNAAYRSDKSSYTVDRENAALGAVQDAVALRIADDMDFWNSIHDSENQADADWVRERYGAIR